MKAPNLAKAIRWKYVAPRAAILAVAIMACRLGLDGVLRWALISSGQAALGAKVEIGDLSTKLLDGELVLSEVAAANPSKPLRNLFDAQQIQLNIDAGLLLHKRIVVRDGLVSGLRFDSVRTESGSLDGAEVVDDSDGNHSALDPLVAVAQQRTEKWLDDVTGRIEGDLTAGLKTPAVLEELESRWPQQYQTFKDRVDSVREKAKQIETDFRSVRQNPLRNLALIQSLQQQIVTAEAELRSLQADVRSLPMQAESDRIALDEARKYDQQYLSARLDAGAIDGDQLSRYLLGDAAGRRVATAVGWIKAARRMAPVKKVDLGEKSRRRGVNVLFVGQPEPSWLVESLRLDGSAAVDGSPLRIVGKLENLSSNPQLIAEPILLRLTGAGGFDFQLDAELDRRTAQARDVVKLYCPALPLPARTLGKSDRMTVSLAASSAEIAAEFSLVDDNLTGTIQLIQPQVAITASAPAFRDAELGSALTNAFSSLEKFGATMLVSGSLDKPEWKLESDLGEQLADGFNAAVRDYLKSKANGVMALVQARVDDQLAKLDEKRQAAQAELLAKLGENQELVAQLGNLTGEGLRPNSANLPVPQLGEALKSGIFKR